MTMLLDVIKERAKKAMIEKDSVARDILRLAQGEIQTIEARNEKAVTDDEAAAVVRKLIKSNQETSANSEDVEQKKILALEISTLESLLPKSMSHDEILAALAPVYAAIKEAKTDGQATGVAMKQLKQSGANASGIEVTAVVKALRTPA
ncbi:MAG: GatB/YqeY domain-containing protein [Polyangiaceae bacterium]